jgi:hypothetical protein
MEKNNYQGAFPQSIPVTLYWLTIIVKGAIFKLKIAPLVKVYSVNVSTKIEL